MQQHIADRARITGLQMECSCDGNLFSEIAVVATAPGDREVQARLPLIGGAGIKLWTPLRKHKLTRTDVYITNVIKRQIASDADDRASVGADELQHWESILRWELSQLPNLRYILVLGGVALTTLTGEKGVTNWRGSVIDIELRHVEHIDGIAHVSARPVTCVITYNPVMCIRDPKTEPVFRMDLHKFNRVLEGQFKPHDITHHINPTPKQAIEWVEEMQYGKVPVAFDIETMSGETACVGLANNAHEGMCINFRDEKTNRWSLEQERQVFRRLQALFWDESTQLIAQNGMYDITWLWYKNRIRVRRLWFDTLLAHHTLYSQLPHGLGFLTAQYTNHPYYKDDGKTWREGGDIDQFWRYNVKDACITRACQLRMLNELLNFKQDEFFFGHVMRLQPHLARVTVGGVAVDHQFKEKLTEELQEKVAELRNEFVSLTRLATRDPSLTINPNSPKQLAQLFFKKLNLIGRGTSTDAINRKRMHDHPSTGMHARAMINKLDEFKKEDKFRGTYAEMKIDPDGRVRCEYKQTGVQSAPGRLSSAQVMWGSGGNLQNWPDRAHHMVVADEDYCLVYFDLSQAEARVVGWLANIEKWIAQFEQARIDGNFDCHRALASEMFDIEYELVPTFDRSEDGTPTIRFVAKRCRYGLNYRMAPDRLAETTGLALARAVEAYNIYHRQSPEIRAWWREVEAEARKNKKLVSPLGRVLRIMERITDDALESIIAFKPQSTIGDHVCRVIYLSEDDPKWPRLGRVALNIHDALIGLVHKRYVTQAARIFKRHAEMPMMVNGRRLIIPAVFGVSRPDEDGVHRWSTIKKVKTLDELDDVVRDL